MHDTLPPKGMYDVSRDLFKLTLTTSVCGTHMFNVNGAR